MLVSSCCHSWLLQVYNSDTAIVEALERGQLELCLMDAEDDFYWDAIREVKADEGSWLRRLQLVMKRGRPRVLTSQPEMEQLVRQAHCVYLSDSAQHDLYFPNG